MIKVLLTDELGRYYDKYLKKTPYNMSDTFKDFFILELKIDDEKEYMYLESFIIYEKCRYWVKLIEFDFMSLHHSLVFCNAYLGELGMFRAEDNFGFLYHFDAAINKYFSILDRLSQLINDYLELGLDQEYEGDLSKTVSFFRVISKIKKTPIGNVINEIIIHPNFKKFVDIRNATVHSYHPMLKIDFYDSYVEDDEFVIKKMEIYEDDLLIISMNLFEIYYSLEVSCKKLLAIIHNDLSENIPYKNHQSS